LAKAFGASDAPAMGVFSWFCLRHSIKTCMRVAPAHINHSLALRARIVGTRAANTLNLAQQEFRIEPAMPTTVNGIGTHYYGKKNLTKETGQCEFCGNVAELWTYETGYYFVLIFIPLIPLGKKQILDDCRMCRQHRAIPAKEWARLREEALGSSTDKLTQGMDDPAAAIEHLQTLTAFKQFEEAKELAPAIEAQHSSDVDVQFFMGAWYEKYGTPGSADACFEKAYRIDPQHPGALRAKIVGLIQDGQFDESAKLMVPLKPPSENYDPSVFFMLANGYQSQSRHQGSHGG